MDWIDVEVFRVAARELSITRTAERMHLSKGVVSQRIARLERSLKVQLLARTTTRVDLAPAGRVVLEWADETARSQDELRAELKQLTGDDDTPDPTLLRIGVGFGELATDLDEFYRSQLKGVDLLWVQVSEPRGLEALEAGELDMYYSAVPPSTALTLPPAVSLRTVYHDPIWVLFSEALAAEVDQQTGTAEDPTSSQDRLGPAVARLDSLTHLKWVISPPGEAFHDWEREVLAEHGISPVANTNNIQDAFFTGRYAAFTNPVGPLPAGLARRPLHPQYHAHRFLAWDSARFPLRIVDRLYGLLLERHRGFLDPLLLTADPMHLRTE